MFPPGAVRPSVRSPAQRQYNRAVRLLDFSKTTTPGNWSADILVRSRISANPEADKNVQCR
jgi:hypothetical protein